MMNNYLVTGPPRSGKTTVIEEVRDQLEAAGSRVGGIYCPDLREAGERVGFKIVDIMTGNARILAHIDQSTGPRVGKYRVNVENIDQICEAAFPRALAGAECIIIDEIAPMETYSDKFIDYTKRAFDSQIPVLAAIHYRSTTGFIGETKNRDDVLIYDLTEESQENLPSELVSTIFTIP